MTTNHPAINDDRTDDTSGAGRVPAPLAVALASGAYLVPYALSRSTSPSPDHPRVLLWYRLLRKPAIQPPDIAVPLTWLGVETGLAYAAYRLLRLPTSAARNRSLALLAGNIVGIGGWSRLFFGERNLPIATVASAALLVSAGTYVDEVRKVDRRSTAASVPLVAWVAFATVLTAALWRKNR